MQVCVTGVLSGARLRPAQRLCSCGEMPPTYVQAALRVEFHRRRRPSYRALHDAR